MIKIFLTKTFSEWVTLQHASLWHLVITNGAMFSTQNKTVMSDNLGLVDFVIRPVWILSLTKQVKI